MVEHQRAESEVLRFDSSWRLRIFSLSHACDKTENIFLYFFTKLKLKPSLLFYFHWSSWPVRAHRQITVKSPTHWWVELSATWLIPFFQIFLHLTLEYRLINTDLKLDWLRCFHSCEAVNFFVTLKNPTKTLFFLQISSHQSHFQFNIEFYVVILNSFICVQTVNVVDLLFYYKGDVWCLYLDQQQSEDWIS